ncbi:MAG TPA: hypothetical protein VIJ01_07445 [Candidatus Angelobacter sp.]
MEPVIHAAEMASKVRPYKWAKIVMAVITTLLILVAISKHWSTFDPSKKIMAVVVLINLLLSPPIRPRWAIFKYLEENESDPDYLVLNGCTSIFLVAMLFT